MLSRAHRIAVGATAVAFVLALASSAHAQRGPAAEGFAGHQGFMIGFGLGLSIATCGDCEDTESSLGFDFNIGGFLNPRLALMYDIGAWFDSEDGASLSLSTHTVAAQYWATPQLWLKGGLGFSQVRFDFEGGDESEAGLGITLAMGFEVLKQRNFALDLSGRLSHLDFDGFDFQTVNLVVGARWK